MMQMLRLPEPKLLFGHNQAVEDPREILRADARAIVGDGHQHGAILGVRR